MTHAAIDHTCRAGLRIVTGHPSTEGCNPNRTLSKKSVDKDNASSGRMQLHILTLLSLTVITNIGSAFQFPQSKSVSSRQFPPPVSLLPRPTQSTGFPPWPARRTTSATTTSTSVASATQSLLHGDPTFVLTAVLWLSTFGISLEKRTTLGKALSAPLATMALALIVANLGIIPFESPIYSMTNRFLVPLAVPMLLFDSDLQRVIKDTGSLLLAFGVGALATVVGTLVAFTLLQPSLTASMGSSGAWRVACALAARHIGGAINFVAVADTLKISGSAVSAAIAADNVVVALYFAGLFALSPEGEEDVNQDTGGIESRSEVVDPESVSASDGTSSQINLSSMAIALAVASTLVACGRGMTHWLLPQGTSALPMISMLTVTAATLRPAFFSNIRGAGTSLGILFIQMFFASSGAAGSLRLVMQQAPSLFIFSALQIAVHYVTLVGLGRGLFRLPFRELHLASNANVGGPTTAAAMAQAKQWKRLVLPALLVGILGYATATAIALALGPILLRLPTLG